MNRKCHNSKAQTYFWHQEGVLAHSQTIAHIKSKDVLATIFEHIELELNVVMYFRPMNYENMPPLIGCQQTWLVLTTARLPDQCL